MQIHLGSILLFITVWLFGLFQLYFIHDKRVQDKVATVTQSRAKTVQQHVDLARAIVDQMRQQMTANILLMQQNNFKHPARAYFKDYPELNAYGSDGLGPMIDGIPSTGASFTGVGSQSDVDEGTWREINAALALSLDLGRVVTDNPNFIWSYYTSKKQFMYIMPKVAVHDFHFHTELYQKPFWQPAIPENNPEAKIVISDLYDDGAGQGYMFTVSAPVMVDGHFRGVVSLDLGLAQLRAVLSHRELEGQSIIIDPVGQIVAAPFDFKLGQTLNSHKMILEGLETFVRDSDHQYYGLPILKKELYLVHQVTMGEKISLIVTSMLFHSSVLTFILLILYLVFWLRNTVEKVTELASHDSLTGLLNRRAIKEGCRIHFDFSDRNQSNISVLMIDIDYFKPVNDSYGHDVGDEAICMVADILDQYSRKTDLVARVGGEEFLIVLPSTALEDARRLADKIRKKVESVSFNERKLQVTVSLGCIQRQKGEAYDAVLKRVDQALYGAKHAGRNCVICQPNPN